MKHEFPQALLIDYKALKDLVYPLITHVCDPRGMEKADTAQLFDARCSTCLVKLDTNVLLEIAALQVTGTLGDDSSGQAQPITNSCPKCGSNSLAIQLVALSDEEKQNLLNDKVFKDLL